MFEFADIAEQTIDKNKADTLTSLKIDKEDAIAILREFGYEKSSQIKNKDFAEIFKAMKRFSK